MCQWLLWTSMSVSSEEPKFGQKPKHLIWTQVLGHLKELLRNGNTMKLPGHCSHADVNSEVTESAESYRELPTSLGTFTWPASSWLSCCGYLMFPLAVRSLKREEFYKLNCCSDGVLLQYLYLNSVSSLGQPAFSQVFSKAVFMARWLIL